MHSEVKERDIVNLEAKVGQLEHVRQRQADEIFNLTQSRDAAGEKRDETLRELMDELNKLRFTLNDMTHRQKEVSHFTLSDMTHRQKEDSHFTLSDMTYRQNEVSHFTLSDMTQTEKDCTLQS